MFTAVMSFAIIVLILFFFNKRGIPCIMYHNISDDKGVSPEEFEKHLELIQKNYSFKFEEIESLDNKLPKNSILLTFDDGYADNYHNAFPLLKKYNIKATIFLNTAYINRKNFYMNWKQIKEMYESGLVDFQLHTHSHFSVVSDLKVQGFIPFDIRNKRELFREMRNIYGKENIKEYPVFKKRGETAIKGYKITNEFIEKYDELLEKYKTLEIKEKHEKLKKEIEKNLIKYIKEYTYEEYEIRTTKEILLNKEFIENNLGKKAEYLANPWGHKSKELVKILKKDGVKGMITTKKGTNSMNLDIYKIRRYEAKSFKKFKLLLFINKNYLLGKIYELVS